MRRGRVGPGAAAALLAVSLVAACRPGEPQPILYGEDVCEFCQMVIADQRYGAQLITTGGRVQKFDAVECLAAQYLGMDADQVASLWVTDFANPGRFVPAGEAFYLRSDMLRSPMGLNLTAFGDASALEATRQRHGGETLDWPGVMGVVEEAWLRNGPRGQPVPGMHRHPQAP